MDITGLASIVNTTPLTYADGYLLDRRCINAMYSLMVRLFPLIHGVFSMIVSSRRSHVGPGPGGATMTLDAPNCDDDYSDDNEGYVDDGLTKQLRSVVEFFIAKLRLGNAIGL